MGTRKNHIAVAELSCIHNQLSMASAKTRKISRFFLTNIFNSSAQSSINLCISRMASFHNVYFTYFYVLELLVKILCGEGESCSLITF